MRGVCPPTAHSVNSPLPRRPKPAATHPQFPPEQVLLTACDDQAIKMWRLPSFEKRGIIATRAGHGDVVRCLAKGPGNSFFSGSMDKSIMVWEFMAPS
eukprot:scaffold14986_cov46-Isochrysis_galbana.AAC.2